VAESPLTIIALGKINTNTINVYPNQSYVTSGGTINLSDYFKTAFAAYPYSATRPSAGGPYFNIKSNGTSQILIQGTPTKGTAPTLNYSAHTDYDYTPSGYPFFGGGQPVASFTFSFTNNHGTTFSVPFVPSVYAQNFQITGGFMQIDDVNDQHIADFIYVNTTAAVDVAGPTFHVGNIPAATSSYNWSPEFSNNGDNGIQFTTSGNNITTKFAAAGATGFRPAFKISAMKNTKDNKYAFERTINFCRWNYQNIQGG
jgi:hypothetical protein